MKTTFKQFIFLFFVLFAIVITGCGKDDEKEEIQEIFPEHSEYDKYIVNNLYDVECCGSSGNKVGNTVNLNFSGLKNNHLYLRSVQFDTLYRNDYLKWKTVMEWEDAEITTKEQKVYLGYGDYKNFTISFIEPRFFSTNGMDFIANVLLSDGYKGIFILIFKYQESIKKIATNNYMNMISWYQGSVLASYISHYWCYSAKGDILYTLNTANKFPDANAIPTSYEESISVDRLTITKYNWKEGKQSWSVEVVSPFNEPLDSKYTSTLLDKSTNIWKYKVNILYYDGTKKDFMFTVNVNDGEVKNI